MKIKTIFMNIEAFFMHIETLFMHIKATFMNIKTLFMNHETLITNIKSIFMNIETMFMNIDKKYMNIYKKRCFFEEISGLAVGNERDPDLQEVAPVGGGGFISSFMRDLVMRGNRLIAVRGVCFLSF